MHVPPLIRTNKSHLQLPGVRTSTYLLGDEMNPQHFHKLHSSKVDSPQRSPDGLGVNLGGLALPQSTGRKEASWRVHQSAHQGAPPTRKYNTCDFTKFLYEFFFTSLTRILKLGSPEIDGFPDFLIAGFRAALNLTVPPVRSFEPPWVGRFLGRDPARTVPATGTRRHPRTAGPEGAGAPASPSF